MQAPRSIWKNEVLPSRASPLPQESGYALIAGHFHSQIKNNRGGQHIFSVGAGLARDAGTALYLEERCDAIASKPAPTREWLRSYSGSLSQLDQKQSRRPTYFLCGSRVSVRASRLAQLSRLPSMRQQLPNLTRPLHRQASKNVLQISIRIMPVELGRLDQAHQRSSALATA